MSFSKNDNVILIRPIRYGEFGWNKKWYANNEIFVRRPSQILHINEERQQATLCMHEPHHTCPSHRSIYHQLDDVPFRLIERVYKPDFKVGDQIEYWSISKNDFCCAVVTEIFPHTYKIETDNSFCYVRHNLCRKPKLKWKIGCKDFEWDHDLQNLHCCDQSQSPIKRQVLEDLLAQIDPDLSTLCPDSWTISKYKIEYDKESGIFYSGGGRLGTKDDLSNILNIKD